MLRFSHSFFVREITLILLKIRVHSSSLFISHFQKFCLRVYEYKRKQRFKTFAKPYMSTHTSTWQNFSPIYGLFLRTNKAENNDSCPSKGHNNPLNRQFIIMWSSSSPCNIWGHLALFKSLLWKHRWNEKLRETNG